MDKKKIKEFLEQFDEYTEIVVIDSIGSEFPIDRLEWRDNKAVIILKRSYKHTDTEQLPLKLETERHDKR